MFSEKAFPKELILLILKDKIIVEESELLYKLVTFSSRVKPSSPKQNKA